MVNKERREENGERKRKNGQYKMKTEEWRMKNCMEHNYGLGRRLFTFSFSLHGWFLVQHAYLFA